MTPTSEQRRAFDSAIGDMAARFAPDLIIISAGFDAHQGDPLGQLLLVDEDFVQMTRVLKQWAAETCGGRIVSCMEGGYNLDTLGETVRMHVRELKRNHVSSAIRACFNGTLPGYVKSHRRGSYRNIPEKPATLPNAT
jgi:acetoin utilization deacetylase AcuC-like enzyme